MTLKDLLAVYPHGKIMHEASLNPDEVSFYDGGDYLVLNRKLMNETEFNLLSIMFSESQPKSPWQKYLNHSGPIPIVLSQRIHCIYLISDVILDPVLWKDTFVTFFESYLDAFYIDTNSLCVVLGERTYSEEELEGFMKTMDEDFSTKTTIYCGSITDMNDQAREIFLDEYSWAKAMRTYISQGVIGYKDSYLELIVRPQLLKHTLSQAYRNQLQQDPATKEIVKALWDHKGNLSSAAQALFMHRNSLNYKLDKFEEHTHLNLRLLDDLLLVYLLICNPY